MAKNKIERIDQEIAKTREKIAEQQEKLKALEAQKTEAENLEIVQMVRALRLTPEQFRQRAQAMKQGLALPSEDDVCDGTPGEGVACRAGRSAFWINWQGGMTPCGMMTQPLFSVPELGFAQAWERTRAATERIRLPGACAGCRLKEICHACAAMCVTETGHFDTKPEYVCEMTHETVRRTIEEAENGNS